MIDLQKIWLKFLTNVKVDWICLSNTGLVAIGLTIGRVKLEMNIEIDYAIRKTFLLL